MKSMNNVRMGTLGGTLCSLWSTVDWNSLLHTVLTAAVGATVSYLVSRLLDKKAK